MHKKLPYGTSNFEDLIAGNYYYVDKTKYIEVLEQEENRFHIFIRPRKFGKSLFLSMLSCYYDINKAARFENLFKGTYIAAHPTAERNQYAILKFNFSGINTNSEEEFIRSFQGKIQNALYAFLERVQFSSQAIELQKRIEDNNESIKGLERVIEWVHLLQQPLYIIIDEYDHFANDLIAMGRNEVYKKMIRANGVVRDFYETLKIGTESSVKRIFITGISPVMLDDLTSGFNIASNLTLSEAYNEMLGFTQTELQAILDQCDIVSGTLNMESLKKYYDGYLFCEDASERLYNPSMLFYYLNSWIKYKRAPRSIYDENMRTDYARLANLIAIPENRIRLQEIIVVESTVGQIVGKFSIDNMGDTSYFVSLLYYLGLLTIDCQEGALLRLRIPNYTIKTLYWGYLDKMMKEEHQEIRIDVTDFSKQINLLMAGDALPFVQYLSEGVLSKLSNRDLQGFGETHIKVILLARLFDSNAYFPVSERENEFGYSDIYLQRSDASPVTSCEWLFELKYVKEKDRKMLPKIRTEAMAQLERYRKSAPYVGRTDLKSAVLLFIGKKNFEVIMAHNS